MAVLDMTQKAEPIQKLTLKEKQLKENAEVLTLISEEIGERTKAKALEAAH